MKKTTMETAMHGRMGKTEDWKIRRLEDWTHRGIEAWRHGGMGTTRTTEDWKISNDINY